MQRSILQERIKSVKDQDFEELALAVFQYQANSNSLYRQYLDLLGVTQAEVRQLSDIPFLPIQFFKAHHIQSGSWSAVRHPYQSRGSSA